jgi:hypothetical protein
MLINKNSFLNYSNLCQIMSFNSNVLNRSIWNIRNYIRYIFFFLLKKAFFFRLLVLYKFFFLILNIKKLLEVKLHNINISLFMNLLLFNKLLLKKYYFSNYLISSNIFLIIGKSSLITNVLNNNNINTYSNKLTSLLFYYNYLYFLFKTYVFIVFLWLYSIKFFNFFNLNISSIPIKKKIFTVLRSPHKDKKAREKFKINKIKKTLLLPSFLGNNLFFIYFLNESISIQNEVSINK